MKWEKIFAKDAADKGLISKIQKQFIQPNAKKNKKQKTKKPKKTQTKKW